MTDAGVATPDGDGPGGRDLPAELHSLALGAPACAPGTIFALSLGGGIAMSPKEGREIVFGRNRPDVHVCLGEDDLTISRRQGTVSRLGHTWWVRTDGQAPLRMPDGKLLFRGEDPAPLHAGYTPVFVRGTRGREHLLELYVAGSAGRPSTRHEDATAAPRRWRLSPDERLVLVALGQRYLLHDDYPAPLTWRQVVGLLADARPDGGWTPKRVEHLVVAVRARLSAAGVTGLTREEVGEPVGNALNDNLLRELLLSTTLVPLDLDLLG